MSVDIFKKSSLSFDKNGVIDGGSLFKCEKMAYYRSKHHKILRKPDWQDK